MPRDPVLVPGAGWRWARWLTQGLVLLVVVLSPFLGGWQRLDRSVLATWEGGGTALPAGLGDRLPSGEPARRAHRANRLLGVGTAADALSVPAVDPVAGGIAALHATPSPQTVLALALPLLLAALAGRVFCGWLCPFGTIARALARALARLGRRPFRIPERRPIRWLVLLAAFAGGLAGSHLIVSLTLPHLLVQQSVLAGWLLGGGSAVLGLLLGLLVAGSLFGPTTYCAAVCPTGAALCGVARRRLFRLRIASVEECGRTCSRCDQACWMQLRPSSGDAGPDCDLCARCTMACPASNLRIGVGAGPRKRAARMAAVLLAPALLGAGAEAAKPQLLLRGEVERGGVTVAVSVVDLEGVGAGVDTDERLSGIELSAFLARAERLSGDPPDRRREVYRGPLTLRLIDPGGRELAAVQIPQPNAPRSTPWRTLYRRRLDLELPPGSVVVVEPPPGWLEEAVRWEVPGHDGRGALLVSLFAVSGGLAFSGIVSLALGLPRRAPGKGPRIISNGSSAGGKEGGA